MGKLSPKSKLTVIGAMALAIAAAPAALAAEPPPLTAYGELPDIEDMAVSPNGGALAFVARISGERNLVLLDAQRQVRRRSGVGDAMKVRALQWGGDEQVVLVTSQTQRLGPGFTADKIESYNSIIVPIASDAARGAFQNRSSMASPVFGNYGLRLIDGKWYGFYGGVELRADTGSRTNFVFDNGRPALFSVGVSEPSLKRVASSAAENHDREWLVDAQGKVAALYDLAMTDGRWRITNAQGTTLAEGVSPSGRVGLVSLGRDGASVIYSKQDPASKEQRWYEAPLTGGASSEFLPGVDVNRLFKDRATGALLGYLENKAGARPVMYDAKQQSTLRKIYNAFPKLQVDIADWTPTFSHVLVHTSGNGDSGTWYLVDVAQLKAELVGVDRTKIGPEHVGPISMVDYRAGDGLQLDGVLTLPPGKPAKNLPVILLPHGGPSQHDTASFDWWAQAFASRGYAVFQPNFRGSTNRDGAFVRAGYGQWGRKMQTDISDGLAELAKQGIVDPKRACIVGASYGGYAALAGVTLQQDIYRCAVAVAPVSDLTDMYWTDYRESGGSDMLLRNRQEQLGPPSKFAEVSPRRHAARASAPILLIHGKDDTVVPFKQSSAMADALKDAGKPHEMVVLREEDHWLSRSATRQQMLDAAVRFVGQHNPAN